MKHILLLEPDRMLAETCILALRACEVEVCVQSVAQEAIYAADQHLPDLVIMELQLISHSGLEFLYEFRSYTDWKDVPIIVHTLVPTEEFSDSQEILFNELNVSEYLYKPTTSLRTLLKRAQMLLNVPTNQFI